MKKLLPWTLPLLALLFSSTLHAEIVTLTLPNSLVARADFRPGKPEKPAVLLLHGFLQTLDSPSVSRLANNLSSEGYTVLTPTLTLGVTYRSQSVACEAINHHTVADGEAEIKAWVDWLKARKARQIVLGGHSLGNAYILSYLTNSPDNAISKFIGISIVEGSLKAGEQARSGLINRLRGKAASGDREIVEEQFTYCQKFRATPNCLLSYMEWGPDRILSSINKTRIPVTMIMGSKDDRLGADWLDRLKKTRAKVVLIQGANHFMDGQYEFDLMDYFLAELQGI